MSISSSITEFSDAASLAGSPERSIPDWLVKLQNKAANKANATSGALYERELALLVSAYGRYIMLDQDVYDALHPEPAFSTGFNLGFEA